LQCYNKSKIEKQCNNCKNTIIFKGLKILSDEETLDEIIRKNKSISRFGDGEFKIIFGYGVGFQDPNNIISKRLLEVLNNNEKDLLIGLNFPYKKEDLKILKDYEIKYWRDFFNQYKFQLHNLINNNRTYYSATISRFYMRYKKRKNIDKYIKMLKKIWNSKNILIIEGEKSRLGMGNDLFDNAKSIKRIICPPINAFHVYNKIIKKVINLNEKRLILIALGPTATILAYDLHKLGFQSIDIGHVDIEYEWFLRNCSRIIPIENKYVNEAKDIQYKHIEFYNRKYENQIIEIIK
jgi:glycosyltransferase family protein